MKNKSFYKKDILRIGIDGRVMQDKNPSGIPLYAINTIREILKLDHKNEYIIFFNSLRNLQANIPDLKADNLEIKFFRFPNKLIEWAWTIFPYPKIDKLLKTDIFFSPHFLKIPLSKEVRKIVTIHDLSFEKDKRYFSFRKNLWHWQMNPKKICQNVDKIVSVSESTKYDLQKIYHLDQSKIKVIHNGSFDITTDFLEEQKEYEILKKFGVSKSKYILSVATIEPRKNIDGLINSFAMIEKDFPEHKLLVAGKKGWLFENIIAKAKKYNLNNRIIFSDYVTEEEKTILIKNCSVFVLPSFYEGFGLPLLEASNQNKPVITSANSSIPEIVKDTGIIINPHFVSDITHSINEILGDDVLANYFRQKENSLQN